MVSSYINEKDVFIIAEVGQNHQGDVEIAKSYINEFSKAGADAIKFQTRDIDYLFSKEGLKRPYDNPNSFGATYGDHRKALELSIDNLKILRDECRRCNVKFMSTPFDEPSLEVLNTLEVDAIKVASFDLGNLPFLERIAQKNIPTIMSIGGGKINHIRSSVEIFEKYNIDLSILHCVSEYPCDYKKLGLNNISELIKEFPNHNIGLSDHFNGILSGPIAYLKGARVFEKHVTFNRSWKGTDHSFALEVEGFRKFVRDIKRVKDMLPIKQDENLGNEPVFKKLGKSVVAYADIPKNTIITCDMISGKIMANQGIPVRDVYKIIGKNANKNIKKGESLNFSYFS